MPSSNSSASSASKSTKSTCNRKRDNQSPEIKKPEYELNKDGELVPVSGESNSGDDLKLLHDSLKDGKSVSESANASSSRNKRKQNFERRNIKWAFTISFFAYDRKYFELFYPLIRFLF